MALTDVVTAARGLITGGGRHQVASAPFAAVVLGGARVAERQDLTPADSSPTATSSARRCRYDEI
jgi:hypothetical protein